MVVNAAQLATYSQAKQNLLATGICCEVLELDDYNIVTFLPVDYFVDDIKCHFAASMISGLVTTIVSMPVDIAKTR